MLTQCIQAAVLKADLRPEQVKGIACGLSGVDTVYDARKKKLLLRSLLQELQVPDDVRPFPADVAKSILRSCTSRALDENMLRHGDRCITSNSSDRADDTSLQHCRFPAGCSMMQ